MKRKLALLLIFLLAGCQELIIVKVEYNNSRWPSFIFNSADSLFKRTPSIWELAVVESIRTEQGRKVMWYIKSLNGEDVSVTKIKYGIIPQGFVEQSAAIELSTDMEYEVHVTSKNGVGGAEIYINKEDEKKK